MTPVIITDVSDHRRIDAHRIGLGQVGIDAAVVNHTIVLKTDEIVQRLVTGVEDGKKDQDHHHPFLHHHRQVISWVHLNPHCMEIRIRTVEIMHQIP